MSNPNQFGISPIRQPWSYLSVTERARYLEAMSRSAHDKHARDRGIQVCGCQSLPGAVHACAAEMSCSCLKHCVVTKA